MKNEKYILLLICSLALMFVLGLFVGRRTNSSFKELKYNDTTLATQAIKVENNKMDINTASKTQLMELPGIGEVIAEQIIAFRSINGPFYSVEQLLDVEGIGKVRLQQIEEYICIGG